MKKLILAIAFIGMGSFAMAQTTTPQDKAARKAEFQQKDNRKSRSIWLRCKRPESEPRAGR